MDHFSILHVLGFAILFTLILFALVYGIVRVIQAPVKKELDEAKHVAITWWFLPQLCKLEKEILELERSTSDPLNWEAGDNFFAKLKDIRDMDIRKKTIEELKDLMENLRELHHEARFEYEVRA